jgi:large subunit ribosomal protein L25
MPDRPTLSATSRDVVGKKVARLRRAGQVPAVVFGHGRESTPVSIDAHELSLLRRHTGASSLVDLAVDGKRPVPVIIHGVQMDPITRRPLHVDLFAVSMSEELVVDVPLIGSGEAPAVAAGGTLVHQLSSLKVKVLPANMPESLTYDLGVLVDYDASITVADVALPDGVALAHSDPGEVVARVLPPRVIEPVPGEELAAEAESAQPAEEPVASES